MGEGRVMEVAVGRAGVAVGKGMEVAVGRAGAVVAVGKGMEVALGRAGAVVAGALVGAWIAAGGSVAGVGVGAAQAARIMAAAATSKGIRNNLLDMVSPSYLI
jgi:hypothetical protein